MKKLKKKTKKQKLAEQRERIRKIDKIIANWILTFCLNKLKKEIDKM